MGKKNGRGGALVPLADVQLLERQYGDTVDLLQERLAELELAIDDSGWQRLTGESSREFSRDAIRRIAALSRLAFLKNPLIKRSVRLQAFYVWGQGVSIEGRHPDVDAVVQGFLDDRRNQAELTSHQARVLKEIDLQVEGNIFFAFFVNPSTGRVRVRSVPPDEIVDIITSPEDAKEAWFYKRVWTERGTSSETGNPTTQQRTAYYPDWRYTPSAKPPAIGQDPVEWDTPVSHLKVGGMSDMRFGVPETYAALDWAKAYKAFLEDWATIVRALSRFAWNLTSKGGARGVAAAKSKLGTTYAVAGQAETNPPPVTGATFITGEGHKLDPIKTSGATTSAEDGRRLLLMVAAAMGFPESFYGDVSVGTLATAKSLDRPTELQMRDRQTFWADTLHDILQYVIDWSVKAPNGALQGSIEMDDEGEEVITLEDDPETGDPIDRHVEIGFPPILEHDVDEAVKAIIAAAPHIPDPKLIARLLLVALGEDDLDELLDEMFPEGEPVMPDASEIVPEGELLAAARELREAVKRISGSAASS